jgi:hypothetical protein
MQRDWNAHRRAGTIGVLLAQGNKLTTAEIARLLDVTYQGAWYLMTNLSGAPLYITEIDGKWQIPTNQEIL